MEAGSPPDLQRVTVLALAAPRRGWESHAHDLRAAYARQMAALVAEMLNASPRLESNLALYAAPAASGSDGAWVLPESPLDLSRLLHSGALAESGGTIVHGTLERDDEALRLQLTVTEAELGIELARFEDRCDRRNALVCAHRIASRVARLLGVSFAEPGKRLALCAPTDLAVDLYVSALDLELANRSGVDPGTGMSAAGLLGGALREAPSFGPAVEQMLGWAARALANDSQSRRMKVLLGLERATENPDADPRLWTARGLIAARVSTDPEEALAHLYEALDRGADGVRLRIELAERLTALSRPREARRHLRWAADRCPDDPLLLERLGALLGNAGELARARVLWKRGARLTPWDGSFLAQLGRAAASEGALDEAWAYYSRVLLAADIPSKFFQYAIELAKRAEPPPLFVERLASVATPSDREAAVLLGEICLACGRPTEAGTHFRRALALDGDPRMEMRARAGLLRISAPRPVAEALQWTRGQIRRNPRRAVAALESLLSLDDRFAPAHDGLGVAWRKLGREDRAIEHFRRAVELAPDNLPASRELGELLVRRGAGEEAVRALRRVAARVPRDGEVRAWLAQALAAAGREEEAREELEWAMRFETGRREAKRVLRSLEKGTSRRRRVVEQALRFFRRR